MNIQQEINKLIELKDYLFKKIETSGGYERSFDGIFSIQFPGYFDEVVCKQPKWGIQLACCYVLGPGRYNYWEGSTLEEAIEKAKIDIESW